MRIARWIRNASLLALLASGHALGDARDPGTPPAQLRSGEFTWAPEVAPQGPLLLVVSLAEQRAYLYRNGVRIAVTTVSTGKPGFETVPGVYTILQKHEEHYSNLYDDAPMPFMQRLTWSGTALHAGKVPGYPASHGCIRLPPEFAKRLFGVTTVGMTVVVANDAAAAPQWVHPGWLAPTVADVPSPPPTPSEPPPTPATSPAQVDTWSPWLAPAGPMTILVDTAGGSIRVLRNGVEIGRAAFRMDGPAPAGVQVLQLQSGHLEQESAYVPGKPRLRWVQVALGADAGASARQSGEPDALYGHVSVSPAFAREVYDELLPGTTVVVTAALTEAGPPDATLLEAAPGPGETR